MEEKNLASSVAAEREAADRCRAHAALDCLFDLLRLHRATGTSYLRLDTQQGGLTRVRFTLEKSV